jgi:hypothetical protein
VTGRVIARLVDLSDGAHSAPIRLASLGTAQPYLPADLAQPDATLTWHSRENYAGQQDARQTVPRAAWTFANCENAPWPGTPDPSRICVTDAFRADRLYELVYTAKDPLVLGVGLAADDLVLDELTVQAAFQGFLERWPVWQPAGVTAVVCGDDLYAYGVLRACRLLGVEIPAQLSVVGFDDLPYSEFTDPSLTTVNLSAHELGETAAELLQDYLTTGQPPRSRVLATSLVVRDSTGRAG